jgi:hypothetical protein
MTNRTTADAPWVTREEWLALFDHWLITDVAVRTRDIIYLAARQDIPWDEASRLWDHDIPTRLIPLLLANGMPRPAAGYGELTGFNQPLLGASTAPIGQGLLVARNMDGQVHTIGGGVPGAFETIDAGRHPNIQRVRTLFGEAWAVGQARTVYRRVALGRWEAVPRDGLPELTTRQIEEDRTGFRDIDAFARDDIYAVGGHGDVWRFTGARWTRCAFPSNEQLSCVTCGGDGTVYICGEGGSIWGGEGNRWRQIEKQESSVLHNDARWFQGRLWVSSDYGTWTLTADGLVRPLRDGALFWQGGQMDAADGVLVVATQTAVFRTDGDSWQTLVAPYDVQ